MNMSFDNLSNDLSKTKHMTKIESTKSTESTLEKKNQVRFKTMLLCNDIPTMNEDDAALRRHCRIQKFPDHLRSKN
jgi:hypothetical protein